MAKRMLIITHPDIPGSRGSCVETAFPVWEARGWQIVEDDAEVTRSESFSENDSDEGYRSDVPGFTEDTSAAPEDYTEFE